jgi:hypothetical protein
MTPEEHDALYPATQYPTIIEGYIQMDKIVSRVSSLYTDDPHAWVGTVPERLAHLLGRLLGNPTMFNDIVDPIEMPNADDVACAETPYQYRLTGTNIPIPVHWDTNISRWSDICNQSMLDLLALNDPILPPPMAYDHTEALDFFDPINEVGLVGHMPIGTRIGFATRHLSDDPEYVCKIGHTPMVNVVEDDPPFTRHLGSDHPPF